MLSTRKLGRPKGSTTRTPLLSSLDRKVYRESTIPAKDSFIRGFLEYLNETNQSPFGVDPRVIVSWACCLSDNDHGGQAIINYTGTVLEFFIMGNLLVPVPYGDSLVQIVKRRMRTLAAQDPVNAATVISGDQINKLSGNARSLAIFMLSTGLRKGSLLSLDKFCFIPEDQSIVVIPKEIKALPDGKSPAVRLFCVCRHDSTYCFLHGIKIPKLPISFSDINELCKLLNCTSHSFRKTTANQIRVLIEDELTKLTFNILKINSFFVWSPKSKMFKKRYTHAWKLLKKFRFPSVAIIKNFHLQEDKYSKSGEDLRQPWERNDVFDQINEDEATDINVLMDEEN